MRSFLASLVILASMLSSGCLFFVNIPMEFPTVQYSEVVLEPGRGKKILLLDIDGPITSGPRTPGGFLPGRDSTVNQVAEKLRKARAEHDRKRIAAVVLRIDTPGGGVTASDTVFNLINNFREETGLPVYVSMMDMATSGGYYIAMAADEIYAAPTTITGSVGVIAMFPQLENLGNKVGVYVEIIKSGDNKDLTGGFKNMTESQREILQETIDELYDCFVDVVVHGRPEMEEERIRELADGRIYTAKQAHEFGLVDGVKYLEEVIDKARRDSGNLRAPVVLYRKTNAGTYDSVYAKSLPEESMQATAPTSANVNFINIDAGSLTQTDTGAVFNYLWVP